MIKTHILGFPRMGASRELKFALERHWRGEIGAEDLEAVGRELRARHWAAQKEAGLAFVTVGDFALYDHVANHIQLLGCEPERFHFDGAEPELQRYFALARGAEGGRPALEMTKWFDTNYHYLVPEFTPGTGFSLGAGRLFAEVGEALAAGHEVKAVLLGPLSFLWLGKEKTPGFARQSLLDRVLPVYGQILAELKTLGVKWVQIDEPILGLDLPEKWRTAFEPAYSRLAAAGISLLLATYFSPLGENLHRACHLPVQGLHVDAVRAPEEIDSIADWLPAHKVLSLGLVDGRNIWRTDLDAALQKTERIRLRRNRELWLAPSCSLLHSPMDVSVELKMEEGIRSWLAFSIQKLEELRILARALNQGRDSVARELEVSRAACEARRNSPLVNDPRVRSAVARIAPEMAGRRSAYPVRAEKQRALLDLPSFPSTTIGSFPQTAEIRLARSRFREGAMSEEDYGAAMRAEIERCVREQEALGLDVLVHGEAERNDMVEYFGEQLEGFAFTQSGWVQSYGSRCVKPPILFGDVSRPGAMTVKWTSYAQSLTGKPMKGMLTGPVTILNWSFVRDDQPRETSCRQIALAIREEVLDLEKAGIRVIQIDEAALREGLPLRRSGWKAYLGWAIDSFRIAANGVRDETQIHTHMCYSEFNDIISSIADMDADVITIETSRSDMELLDVFDRFDYPNEIGPGVYDIHSPNIPTRDQIVRLMRKASERIPSGRLWVNPDCGLKTRKWEEVIPALENMIAAAKILRDDPQGLS